MKSWSHENVPEEYAALMQQLGRMHKLVLMPKPQKNVERPTITICDSCFRQTVVLQKVELGCGGGKMLHYLKRRGYKRDVGVDTSIKHVLLQNTTSRASS